MGIFDYDYDDLAHQIQAGLERIAVSFLRAHGARIRRDVIDFHGHEQIDLELEFRGHTLTVHQAGRPRGPGASEVTAPAAGLNEVFESMFDGWPASNTPRAKIAEWLRELPAGEAPPERSENLQDGSNPLAVKPPKPTFRAESESGSNPFLPERKGGQGGNPFVDADRERKRKEMLRRLAGDED
jgi:hypothetical protein